jgi:selenocysteine-specific elongation factor
MPRVIVGTAGHIDHGKTALVKALTGIDADRLKEEKERGITIDLGFAHLALDDKTTVGFIDVPGHERFIKNMLAGIGGIDLVMLVIAADESVMPQTREHLDICSLLHVKQGLTVLTKVDKVESEIVDLVEAEVREFLKGSFLEGSPIVRASAYTREGIPQLVRLLTESLSRIRQKDDTDIFRLPVDRSFTMKGFGTVVTGTLIAGRVGKDEEVEILPSQRRVRVRGIQVHGQPATEARAGQRTALNLQGIDVSDVQRGMVLTVPDLFTPTSMFDCHLELLPSAPKAIELRKRVRFHIGTTELMGYVNLLGKDRLEPGASAFAQIRLEEPALALPGDRFIVRQYSPMLTIGGGEILDALPEKHRRTDASVLERLRILKDGSAEDRLVALVNEAGFHAIELSRMSARHGFAPARLREIVSTLSRVGSIRVLSEKSLSVVSESVFEQAVHSTLAAVKRFHQTNPLAQGIGREELKERLFRDASPLLYEAVLNRLTAGKEIAATSDVIQEFGRKVTLKSNEEQMRTQLSEKFRSLNLQISSADEVVDALKLDRTTARKIVQLMLKENELVKVSEDLLIDRAALDTLITNVKALKSKSPKLTIVDFKDLTGLTRKHAIPLLEYLDRQRVTRRVGSDRVVL